MTTDVMIDLETTGTSAGCCILSLGACTLDEKYNFYMKISHDSCKSSGLKDLQSTMDWWSKQHPMARDEAFSGTKDLVMVLGAFADWMMAIRKKEGDTFVWGNGADFDLPILGAAYEIVGMEKPWRPFNGRCYRTFKNLPENKEIKMDKFEGMKHNALDDAKMQARHMLKILRSKK